MDTDKLSEIRKEFACGCEVCTYSAAICPATASSLILEIATLRRELRSAKEDILDLLIADES